MYPPGNEWGACIYFGNTIKITRAARKNEGPLLHDKDGSFSMRFMIVLIVGIVAGLCLIPTVSGYAEEMSFDQMRQAFSRSADGRAASCGAAVLAARGREQGNGSKCMWARWRKAATAASPRNRARIVTGSGKAGFAIWAFAWMRRNNTTSYVDFRREMVAER